MVIKKKKGTYNTYDVELSWGQIETLKGALEQNHADPIADEALAEISWYMERVAGPGVEQEEIDAKQKASQEGGMGGVEGQGSEEEGDMPVPMPPGGAGGGAPGGAGGEQPTFPPGEGDVPDEGGGAMPPGGAGGGMKPGGKPGGLGSKKPGGPGGEMKPPGGDEAELGLPEPGADGGPGAKLQRPAGKETDRRLPKPPRE
jgi:hypothetical protein